LRKPRYSFPKKKWHKALPGPSLGGNIATRGNGRNDDGHL
jgi:hypothetical protein